MSTTNDERVIGYVGNFGVNYSTESHVARSLESIEGVRVVRHQENEVDWATLAVDAESGGYDFMLWTHTHGMADESFHEVCQAYVNTMADRGIPTVGYHLDKWWDLEREHQVYEPFFTQAIVCTADGGHQREWTGIGVNHIWMPPAVVHDEVGRGVPSPRYVKELGFLGSWMHYGHLQAWPWRYDMVIAINKRYGAKFRAWPRAGQPIRGMDINNLYASVKVMIGDSCLAGGATHYWSDRVPETLGRGGLLVHPRVEGLSEQFPIGQPLLYDAGDVPSFMYAVEQALALDADERDFLIDEAIEFVRARHTYRVRMLALFDIVDQYKGASDDPGAGDPQERPVDVGQRGRDRHDHGHEPNDDYQTAVVGDADRAPVSGGIVRGDD